MTMTKKGFVEIAAIVAELPAGPVRDRAAERMADALHKTNANFDRSRFLTACKHGEAPATTVPDLREELVALRSCFSDDPAQGLMINPYSAQFKPVADWRDAQTIIGAVDAALNASGVAQKSAA